MSVRAPDKPSCKFGISIRDFEEKAWDAATGGKLMMSHAWLRCMEDIQKRSHPFYALISDDEGPLAALAAPYMKTIEPLQILSGRRVAATLARIILLATVPFYGESSGLAVRAGLSIDEALLRLEPMLKAICRRARRMILAIGNVSQEDLPVWKKFGFQDYELPLGSALHLPETYSSYLELFSGHDRRELARMRRVAEKGGTTFEHSTHTNDMGEKFHPFSQFFSLMDLPWRILNPKARRLSTVNQTDIRGSHMAIMPHARTHDCDSSGAASI